MSISLNTHKECNRCKNNKPLSDYHKNRVTKDGLQNTCKTCKTEIRRLTYDPDKERVRKLSERYKISSDQYTQMYADQKGTCKICLKNFSRLCVDHDHKTGKVRGLLCHNCNTMLGLALDDVSNLTNAIHYLKLNGDDGSPS